MDKHEKEYWVVIRRKICLSRALCENLLGTSSYHSSYKETLKELEKAEERISSAIIQKIK